MPGSAERSQAWKDAGLQPPSTYLPRPSPLTYRRMPKRGYKSRFKKLSGVAQIIETQRRLRERLFRITSRFFLHYPGRHTRIATESSALALARLAGFQARQARLSFLTLVSNSGSVGH